MQNIKLYWEKYFYVEKPEVQNRAEGAVRRPHRHDNLRYAE